MVSCLTYPLVAGFSAHVSGLPTYNLAGKVVVDGSVLVAPSRPSSDLAVGDLSWSPVSDFSLSGLPLYLRPYDLRGPFANHSGPTCGVSRATIRRATQSLLCVYMVNETASDASLTDHSPVKCGASRLIRTCAL